MGRLSRDDSANYWNAITRVVASGFSPTAQLQLNAIALRADSGPHIKSVGKLFLSSPTLLFPLNHASARAAILPQGPSIKVLDESGHAEYLHSILPPTGEGRVILRLEVQQVKNPDGHMVSSVEVFHEDTHVGRLSSQISEQFIPVIEHAAKHDKLTNVWGTIRGNSSYLRPRSMRFLMLLSQLKRKTLKGSIFFLRRFADLSPLLQEKTESARRSRHTKLSQRKQLNPYLSMIFLKNTRACLPSSKL